MNSPYSDAGRIVTGVDGYDKIWGDVSRCGSCGSLVLPEDQDVHTGYHARIDALAALVARPLVEQGKITLNDGRRLMGLPECREGS